MKKPATLLALTATLLGLTTPTLAQRVSSQSITVNPIVSPSRIIVNPTPTTLNARVWVNRDPSGATTPNYRIGDRITIYTTVNENAYVYLFNVNPDGSTDQILPNRLSGSNYVRAGQTRAFPAQGDNFTFDVSGPYGLNKVLVIASRRPLNLSELSSYTAGQSFATVKPQGTQQLAQALSIVVNPIAQPIPQQDWISDTAYYNVSW